MSSPRANPPGDGRAAERYTCHRHCLVRFDRAHLDGRQGSVGAQAALRDLSACGAGLLLRSRLPPGAYVAVQPLDPTARPLPMVRVVRCVPEGDRWHHGCAFGRLLTEEELHAWLG